MSRRLPQRRRRAGGGARAGGAPPAVVVDGRSEHWLGEGFPWVYREEVERAPAALAPGTEVRLRSRAGRCLGRGLWEAEGRVAVRRFRHDDGPIDAALLGELVRAARARRRLPPATTAWRLVHAENDGLPGIRVDAWGPQLSVTLDTAGLEAVLDPLVEAVLGVVDGVEAIHLCARADPHGAPPPAPRPLRGGGAPEEVVVEERGLRFRVRPADGLKAGLFCDLRDLRAWLAPHWSGRRVLNLFAYTGAFTVAAAVGGADEVVSVDLSGAALARLEANLRENGLEVARHPRLREDAFRALDALRRRGERFDVVVADPPSWARDRRGGHWSVERDLPRLVAACLRVLEPGGWLVAATNHGGLSPREFGRLLRRGARRAGRPLRVVHEASPPTDFPAALDFPEARYLKAWVLEG